VSALPSRERQPQGCQAEAEWAQIGAAAAQVAAVMHRYLRQLGTFLAPASVEAADNALRQLARWMITVAGLAEFLPILVRQRDHARHHGQADRAALFDDLIQRTGRETS
jgi:hypothetical protein